MRTHHHHPCRSVTSKKFQCNFIEITLLHRSSPVNSLHVCRIPLLKNTLRGMLFDVWLQSRKICLLLSLLLSLLLLLFPYSQVWCYFLVKKCHNSRHQPVVLGIVASPSFFLFLLFFVISYPTLSVLFSPFLDPRIL